MSWAATTIGDMATVVGGGTPSTRGATYWGGSVPWFTPAEIPESGAGVVTTSERSITETGLAKSAAKLLPSGAVLVTSRASIGNCAIAGVPVATNQGFTSLVPKDARSTRFLYYWVQQNRARFLSRAAGSTFLEISSSKVRDIEIATPTPTEQAAIGEAIAAADDLIDTLERMIAKKQAIKQGMMQQLLTGKTRLSGFNDPWREVALGEAAQFSKGSGLPKSALVADGRQPCVHYGELFTHYGPEIRSVTSRTNDTSLRVRSAANDVLMPTSDVTPRGLAKASALMTNGVVLGGDILVIRSDRHQVFGPFLAHAIRLDANQVLQLVRGSTVYHLYAADMKTFQLKLPPVDEQRAISEVLGDADGEIVALHDRLAKARAVKTGMMQELLTGRTRLPVEEDAA